jgi:glc operon protein GlcG
MECVKTAMIAGAVALLASGALAQVPADPSNPNEQIPEQMAPPAYGEPINLETAKKVAAAARAEVDKRKWRGMCIAVVDPSGDLVYFEKDDFCQYASCVGHDLAAQSAHRGAISPSDFGVRAACW